MTWIKQKNQDDEQRPRSGADTQPGGRRATTSTAGDSASFGQVNIGSSMEIKGELTGSEDLTIDGRVDGKIFLNGHKLTVATNGKITAEINDAGSVLVHGEMTGNITATDRVEVASSGSMMGDIRAPRVVLADGARFKGCIDMAPKAAQSRPTTSQDQKPGQAPIKQDQKPTASSGSTASTGTT